MEKGIILFTIIIFLLRLLFLSPWLEDWDSVQFAIALEHYSVPENLPQPPGYPLYIIIGKLFNLFLNDKALALSLMSAVLGSLTTIPLFLLAKKMFSTWVAVTATLLFAFTPIHWLLSESALTNIPGQFFLVTLSYLLYLYRNSYNAVVIISLFFGLMLGVRFAEIPIIFSLITLVLIYNKSIKLAVFAYLSFLIGLLMWLLPLVFLTGPDNFFNSYKVTANYIFNYDTVIGNKLSGTSSIKLRFYDYFNLLTISYTIYLVLLIPLGIAYLFIKRILTFEVIFILVFLFSYVLIHLLFYNMEVTRYHLPILPAVAILTSVIIYEVFRSKILRYVCFFTILILVASQSIDQLQRFKYTLPATISPVLFVKENFKPEQATIIPTVTLRQFQFYAPNYRIFTPEKITEKELLSRDFIIIDFLETLEKLPKKNYQIIQQKQFKVGRDIFTRVYLTNIYVVKIIP